MDIRNLVLVFIHITIIYIIFIIVVVVPILLMSSLLTLDDSSLRGWIYSLL